MAPHLVTRVMFGVQVGVSVGFTGSELRQGHEEIRL
jgi:hypothetical protein